MSKNVNSNLTKEIWFPKAVLRIYGESNSFENQSNSGNVDSGYNSNFCDTSITMSRTRLEKIDENDDVFSVGFTSEPSTSKAPPLTVNIRSLNQLQLVSPKHGSNVSFNKRSPIKRPATITHDENFSTQCTPKKWSPYATPKMHQSLSASKVVKSNVLRENVLHRTKSLSTSTPKFSYNEQHSNEIIKNVENKMNSVIKSERYSPRKSKTFLKKFQSFSPVSHLRQKHYEAEKNCFGVDAVKKQLKFNRAATEKKLSRQMNIDLDAVIEEPDIIERRNITTTENDYDSWADAFAGSSIECDDKFQNLINAPILSFDSCRTPDKKSATLEQKTKSIDRNQSSANKSSPSSTSTHDKSIPILSPQEFSLCDIILDDQETAETELSVPSIHKFFNKLQKSFEATSSSNDSIINLEDMGKRDSLDLLTTSIFSDQRTPPKRMDAATEKNLILHPSLPKTPTKNAKKLSKRSSTSSLGTTHRRNKISRTTYEGIERLNILGHLEQVKPPLDIILSCLSGEDLVNASMVSKCWQRIIENDTNARERRQNFLKRQIPVKENFKNLNNKEAVGNSDKHFRLPFKQNNTLPVRKPTVTSTTSPPRSPSRFNENQKLVKRLRKDAKLTKCPFCGRSCEIISPNVSSPPIDVPSPRKQLCSPRKCLFTIQETKVGNSARKQVQKSTSLPLFGDKSFLPPSTRSNSICGPNQSGNIFEFSSSILYPDHDSIASSCDTISSFDSSQMTSTSLSSVASDMSVQLTDYAQCTKCGYAFCIKCHSQSHPNRDCVEIGGFSPSKEDEKPIKIKKKGKQYLKRLCY